jgi:hypothetical protein
VLGSGKSIKAAESVAARLALEQMQRDSAPANAPIGLAIDIPSE